MKPLRLRPRALLRRRARQAPARRAGEAARLRGERAGRSSRAPGAVQGHGLRATTRTSCSPRRRSSRRTRTSSRMAVLTRLNADARPRPAPLRLQAQAAALPHRVRLPDAAGPARAARCKTRPSTSTRPSGWPTRNKRVKSMAQFLLVDDGPPIGLTFQSGLLHRNGRGSRPSTPTRCRCGVSGEHPQDGLGRAACGRGRRARAGRDPVPPTRLRHVGTLETVTATGRSNVVRTTVTAKRGGSLRVVYGGYVSRTVRMT